MYSFNSKDQAYDYVDCHFVICQKCFWTATIFGTAKKGDSTLLNAMTLQTQTIRLNYTVKHEAP